MSKLSIVIPVYNERATILKILSRINSLNFNPIEKEIIIIDDFSTDGTREILKKLKGNYKVYYHDKNYGKGMALRTGFKHVTGSWVVVQDADLEYNPNDLKIMLNKMLEPGVKVVYGSRRLHHNYFKRRHSGHFFAFGGIFLTWMANLLYGIKITDEPTCYKMFKTDLIKNINLKCKRFEFCPEVTAKIAKKKIKIHEVEINYYPRNVKEGKKINWKDGIEAIWTLIKYKFIS